MIARLARPPGRRPSGLPLPCAQRSVSPPPLCRPAVRLSSGPTASPPTSTLDPRCHSMPLLQNEVICITGASRGIGECLAHCLAQEGAKKLVLIAEDEEGLKTASGGRRRVWVGGSIATAQRAPAANGPRVRQLPLILAPAQPPCFRPPTRPSLRAPRVWRPSPATLRTQRPCRWVVRSRVLGSSKAQAVAECYLARPSAGAGRQAGGHGRDLPDQQRRGLPGRRGRPAQGCAVVLAASGRKWLAAMMRSASRPVARCKLQDQHDMHMVHVHLRKTPCVLTCRYETAPCRQARGL